MSKVGFIGLGTMGYPMAGHISKLFTTFVFNRTKTKSQKWMHQYKGTVCKSVADLSQSGMDPSQSVTDPSQAFHIFSKVPFLNFYTFRGFLEQCVIT